MDEEKEKLDKELSYESQLTFGQIRGLIDKTVRIQVCVQDTLEYKDYLSIREVPHDYDDIKIFGIGLVYSELIENSVSINERYKFAIEICVYGGDRI